MNFLKSAISERQTDIQRKTERGERGRQKEGEREGKREREKRKRRNKN